ncbi:hypothetical protein [uncultured Desulfuromonas sp.]|uniref:hypothetical protein n=1 Tax=uncultured Desulfuromonas sp. TaxID=181013 RepID=UPI002610839E|nr:hypothetical protein [uncultured Desulfuromonas sp.]
MPSIDSLSNNPGSRLRILPLLLCLLLCACGGGGGGESDPPGSDAPDPAAWEQTPLLPVAAAGLTVPSVAAAPAGDGQVHIAYFEGTGLAERPHGVTYLKFDPEAAYRDGGSDLAGERVAAVDTGNGLSLAAGAGGEPVLLYQGGQARQCGNAQQSDAMFSLPAGGGWQEYTAAIGENPRNPVFQDGLAGAGMAAAVDGQGLLHAVYQFYYEGCDAMNFRYPDLRYVLIDPANPSAPGLEETVEGNDYEENNEQINVGDHAAVVLDGAGNPAVFYYAELSDGTRGLRAARKVDGEWVREWVETGCAVGGVSAAWSEVENRVVAAYYVKDYDDGRDDEDCLRYAREGDTGWTTETVDDSRRVGADCSLGFDGAGQPLIAYREMASHAGYSFQDLKLARLDGSAWSRETVATAGDIGYFNSVWADEQDRVVIASYSDSEQMIYLFRK